MPLFILSNWGGEGCRFTPSLRYLNSVCASFPHGKMLLLQRNTFFRSPMQCKAIQLYQKLKSRLYSYDSRRVNIYRGTHHELLIQSKLVVKLVVFITVHCCLLAHKVDFSFLWKRSNCAKADPRNFPLKPCTKSR